MCNSPCFFRFPASEEDLLHRSHVWGFPFCVDKPVSLQMLSFSEGLVANIACVGLLPTVYQLVHLQTARCSEGLVANVWGFSSVWTSLCLFRY